MRVGVNGENLLQKVFKKQIWNKITNRTIIIRDCNSKDIFCFQQSIHVHIYIKNLIILYQFLFTMNNSYTFVQLQSKFKSSVILKDY